MDAKTPRFVAWAYNGHYILGRKVANDCTLQEGVKAIEGGVTGKRETMKPFRTEPWHDSCDMKHTEKYMPMGSLMVFDSTPPPVGPRPVGGLSLIGGKDAPQDQRWTPPPAASPKKGKKGKGTAPPPPPGKGKLAAQGRPTPPPPPRAAPPPSKGPKPPPAPPSKPKPPPSKSPPPPPKDTKRKPPPPPR